MGLFAKIALVVTLCDPSAKGAAQVPEGGCVDSVSVPHTWASANVVEARQDWDDCKAYAAAYTLRPGERARCKYTAIAGVARND